MEGHYKKLIKYKQSAPSLHMTNNSWASSDTNKANIFSEHLANVFKPRDISPNRIHSLNIKCFLESPLPMVFPAKHTSLGEIQHIIQKFPTKKASGHDLICNLIVENLLNNSLILLALIFNAILRLSYFPTIWKHSNIIIILKPDKPS